MPPEIQTERLILNQFTWQDLNAVTNIISHPTFQDACFGCELPATQYQLARWLQSSLPTDHCRFALRVRQNHQLHGMIAIQHQQLSYWLAATSWQQGLMKEGLTAVLNKWFYLRQNQEIYAEVDSRNVASMGLLKSLGYSSQGELIQRFVITKAPVNRGL